MNIEEIKRRRELYSALAEGKTMQVKNMDGEWVDVKPEKLNCIPEGLVFRIKPESKYRPFKTQEECWNEMLRHNPFGYIRHKENCSIISIDGMTNVEGELHIDLSINHHSFYTPNCLYENYTFTDGEPFGIKEEQV